jgi:hypothetical protein
MARTNEQPTRALALSAKQRCFPFVSGSVASRALFPVVFLHGNNYGAIAFVAVADRSPTGCTCADWTVHDPTAASTDGYGLASFVFQFRVCLVLAFRVRAFAAWLFLNLA